MFIAGLMVCFPEKHGFWVYKASILSIYHNYIPAQTPTEVPVSQPTTTQDIPDIPTIPNEISEPINTPTRTPDEIIKEHITQKYSH